MSDIANILVEKERVREVVTRLFVYTDQLNWPGVLQCFADEVLFDMQSMTGQAAVLRKANDIVADWQAGLSPLAAVHHQIGNFLVQVEDTAATVFCYGIASHYLPNASGDNVRVFVGSYDFHLSRRDDGWRVDQFKFNLKYMDGNPNLEATG